MFFNVIQRTNAAILQNYQSLIQIANSSTNVNDKNLTDILNIKKPLWQTKKLFSSCENSKGGDNLAAVLHGIKDLKMEKRPMPKIQHSNQVLIQMEAVGVCGSDVHFYLKGRIGKCILKKPMITGHEGSGSILECGKRVKGLKPGDKVAIEPQRTCRMCSFCKSGNYHLCPNVYFCSSPPDDGLLCRYFLHEADFCHKLPCNLDLEHGTLMEPLAVAVHNCKRANIDGGDSVLILGSGPIGLASLLTAKAYGATRTMVVDIKDYKVKKAIEMGADYALNIKGCSPDDVIKCIHATLGHKPNKTIDCCGDPKALEIGLSATKSGGKFVLCGLGTDKASLEIPEILGREVDILGSFRYANDYPTAIHLVETEKIDPKPLITHHFKLEDTVEAFNTASGGKTDFIKILIHTNPAWKPKDKKC